MLRVHQKMKPGALSALMGMGMLVLTTLTFIGLLWVVTFVVRVIAAFIGLAS